MSTFLFTDIEGSARLWEAHPEAMRLALARHDALMRAAIEGHDGHVFKTIGDAFCAAFLIAPEALAAQRTLAEEPWPEPIHIRIRAALHTGAAEERGGDYFGPPLNRVARLLAAGHGGQVLLSDVAQGLSCDALPASAALKDLGRPEHVFQLLHPSLSADFPPLRTLDNPEFPNNLPQQATSFIGREREMGEVGALLRTTRVLTLTGAGGCGKTRLSLQVAADVLDAHPDGVWLVELASLSDPALVPQAVAQALGVKEAASKTVTQNLVEWLRDRRLLIVLDNCDHLIAACASLVADLLRTCSHLHVLATSREPLNVAGEQTYRVPSLSLPDPNRTPPVEALTQYASVALFIQRARAVQPSFAVTDANAPAVAQVCWRLDGIPLAIELAAARVRALPVEQVMTRLNDRFRLLTGGSRAALPRQQTLRSAIDWSHDLLTGPERALLRRLSVFADGWTLEAAEAVCGGDPVEDWQVLDLLTSLVDKSLALYEQMGHGEARYRLLETVRQYGRERQTESGEAEVVGERHAAWALTFAEKARSEMHGPEQAAWLSRFEAEHDNLRAALDWYFQKQNAEASLRLAAAQSWFWYSHGHWNEGRRQMERAMELADRFDPGPSQARAWVLRGAGVLAYNQGEHAAAEPLFEEALALFRQMEDNAGLQATLIDMGNMVSARGDYATARALFEESLSIRRKKGDQWSVAVVLNNLGWLAQRDGDIAAARALFMESLALRRQLGDREGIAVSLHSLGELALHQGDLTAARALTASRELGSPGLLVDWLDILGEIARREGDPATARAHYEEGLATARQHKNQHATTYFLDRLGEVTRLEGDLAGAKALLVESLTLRRQINDRKGLIRNLDALAAVAGDQGQQERAARLFGAAASAREALGTLLPLVEQGENDRRLASVREALGETAFAAAWEEGRAMSWEQTVEYALGEDERR